MRKSFYLKTLKMSISATIAIIIADYLGLQFSVTAGVIAILSILNTKRETIRVGARRFMACFIAIILSFTLYEVLGSNTYIFGLFLLIFIPITIKLNIQEGLVPGAVLSTHLLSSSNINILWILNEIILTIIGIGVAFILNLYTPSLEEKFKENKEKIEDYYKKLLLNMAKTLREEIVDEQADTMIIEIDKLIKDTRKLALQIKDNSLFTKEDYYINYIEMRVMQFETLIKMKKHFLRFYIQYEQTKLLAAFTQEVSADLNEDNDCAYLLKRLNMLRDEYKKMELPKSRDEFENRAMLFQFLNDLEDFLIIKREYKLLLDDSKK